ncbi:MAG: TlpA family protein disulfide reductase [Thermoleophilaceae bacterium]|nr:TlpA family protein disulfide reductase [Thermoleophilaceae bacterium]
MKRYLSPFAIAALIGVLALVGLLTYGLVQNEPDRGIDAALQRGERPKALAFELEKLGGGGSGSLEDYRGKVVVLNFWGSWCKPCRTESPLLQRWHERLSQRGRGTVLGVDALDVTDDALDFVREFDLSYPMLKDSDEEVYPGYGVVQFPETFVIDAKGRIASIRRGPVDDEFMRDEVLPLTKEGA